MIRFQPKKEQQQRAPQQTKILNDLWHTPAQQKKTEHLKIPTVKI